jgi:hypothetical protein
MSDTATSGTPVGSTTDATATDYGTKGTDTSGPSNEGKGFSEEYVKELRNESAKYRTERNDLQKSLEGNLSKLSELEEKVKEFERAKLSEQERSKLEFEETKTQNQTLQDQMKAVRLEAAVAKNTVKYELADADATLQLLDKSKVEYGDDGRPSNIDAVLEATLEKYPFLKSGRKSAPDTGATNPGRQKNNTLTREVIASMSHEERVSRMDEISKWMQSGYK